MKKIFIYTLLFLLLGNLKVYAYIDRKASAQNYNKQGELALLHAKQPNTPTPLKRMYLKEAKWFFEKSVNTYSDNFNGYLGLAKAYMYLGISEKAYNNFMIAYNFNEKNVVINYYLGEFNFLNEKYINAIVFYELAAKYGYQNNYNNTYQLAICFDKLGDVQRALTYYRKCLRINPNSQIARQKISELENVNSIYKYYYQ